MSEDYVNDSATYCETHTVARTKCGCSMPGSPDSLHRGQLRIAYRLAAEQAGNLLHAHGIGWHVWDGTRWAPDDRGAAIRAVTDTLRAALAQAVQMPSDQRDRLIADVRRCETSGGVAGVLELAAALNPLAVTVADLDADPYLLNVANGTLDLQTLTLRPHEPADRLTRVTRGAWHPEADMTLWEAFLARVLPDADVRGYLQRLAGLALLGRVVEHAFTIATGTGANGKSTATNALLWALGDYGHAAETDLFMTSKANANAASPALMALRGRRLAVVSETEKDQRLAQALMKNLTGGDPITARPLYGKPVTFPPSHTALMVTNHLPKVAGDDPAVWRRIRVVPFEQVIPEDERDPHLAEHLELAADAVLGWAVAGWQDYQLRGLAEPAPVLAATQAYQSDSDAVARFLTDCCLLNPHATARMDELFARWLGWAADDGCDPLGKRAFGMALERHGLLPDKANHARIRRGVGLLNEDNEDNEDPK